MDLILNGEARHIDASDCANLAELIARAEILDVNAGECVVTDVEIDGEPLPPDELASLEARSIANVRQVSVVRRPRREVASSVLEQGADYCLRIVSAIAQSVDDYRANRSRQANGLLADILDSISVLTGITYSISGVLVEEASTLAELQGEIQPWLEQMLEAQSGNDPILIADLLEYEITPRIEAWGHAMRKLSAISAHPTGGR
jgi:hypothetical protein